MQQVIAGTPCPVLGGHADRAAAGTSDVTALPEWVQPLPEVGL
jgi:hypothetical protein